MYKTITTLKDYPFKTIIGFAFILFALANPVLADFISSTDKYAYAENAGWLDFNSNHEQVTVYDDHLEGFVWSEAVGWIRLGTATSGAAHTYANSAANNYGVNNDGNGNLSGYGWSENAGWINFNPSHSQVTIDSTTGDFDGYAWSESLGWIHFKNASPAYKVQLQLNPAYVPDPGHPGGSIQFTATGQTLSGISITTADGNKPAGMSSPFGKITYTVTSPANGTATVTLDFSTTLPTTFEVYKVDNAGTYTPIPQNSGADGFWRLVDTDTIEVTLKDGGAFDLDGAADGSILDPIVILINGTATAIPTLSFWSLLIMSGIIGWLGLMARRQKVGKQPGT
jgi:hypothetical protein